MTGRAVLYAFRHGETDWNSEGRFQGRSDRPLTERGRAQAASIGARLVVEIGRRMPGELELLSSPLGRAVETMAIVAGYLGRSDYRIEPALAEAGFGCWEGLTTHEVKAAFPEERRARKADRWTFRPEAGESLADVEARVSKWLRLRPRPAIVATHAGVLRTFFVRLAGMTHEEALAAPVPHGTIFRFENGTVRRLD